jgi:hypothetical protein
MLSLLYAKDQILPGDRSIFNLRPDAFTHFLFVAIDKRRVYGSVAQIDRSGYHLCRQLFGNLEHKYIANLLKLKS